MSSILGVLETYNKWILNEKNLIFLRERLMGICMQNKIQVIFLVCISYGLAKI